jgi:hypothetical protein
VLPDMIGSQYWRGFPANWGHNQMGERKSKLNEVAIAVKQALDNPAIGEEFMSVVTPGGRMQVRWDERSSATAVAENKFVCTQQRQVNLSAHSLNCVPGGVSC